jgi:hypothetical protein
MSQSQPLATLAMLRRLLIGLLLVGLVGTLTELLLIGHDEDLWQFIPLVILGVAIVTTLGMVATRATAQAAVTRLFRGVMVLMIVSGAMGSVLHYRANMEFKAEMDPSLSGFALFSSVVRAQAPPALAPGSMALLGLLGLACVFRLDVQTL